MNDNIDKKLDMEKLEDSDLEEVSGGKVPPINKDEQYVMLSGGANDWEHGKLPTETGNYKLGVDTNTVFTPWME